MVERRVEVFHRPSENCCGSKTVARNEPDSHALVVGHGRRGEEEGGQGGRDTGQTAERGSWKFGVPLWVSSQSSPVVEGWLLERQVDVFCVWK